MQILFLAIILLLSATIFILLSRMYNRPAGTIALNEDQKSLLRHDLKGQLGRISALANLISLSSGNFSPEQKEYLKKIDVECKAGMEMISNSLLRKKL
jgi:hypothetical protein